MPSTLFEARSHAGPDVSRIEPVEVVFYDVPDGRVAIEVALHNPGEHRSRPTQAIVQSAPLGAFVPWQPVSSIAVPAVDPGDSIVVRGQALRKARRALGSPDRVSPRRVLRTLALGDRLPAAAALRLAGGPRALRPMFPFRLPWLPADLFELVEHDNPHWAGNLNVFVGRRKLERHLAQALRTYPGRVNLAMFVVGCGPDSYAFRLHGDGASWKAQLFDVTTQKSLTPKLATCPRISEDRWIRIERQSLMLLAIRPPEGCGQGTVAVHVQQHSTRATAVVEFSLDPGAAGPGCFVVD